MKFDFIGPIVEQLRDNKTLDKFLVKFKYFYNSFRPVFYTIYGIIVYFIISGYGTYRYGKSELTRFIRSTYAGSGVFINKTDILTTANLVNNVCAEVNGGVSNFYIIYNDNYHHVNLKAIDSENNLAVLTLDQYSTAQNMINNFALFALDDTKITKPFYTYRVINSLEFMDTIKRNKIDDGVNGYEVKGFKTFRSNEGLPFLDKNLNLVGIATGNSDKSSFLTDVVEVKGIKVIKYFLRNERIPYFENKGNVNLARFKNYKKMIAVNIVCSRDVSRPPRRMFF